MHMASYSLMPAPRFIPTCVGQIAIYYGVLGAFDAVHPHVRGADSHLLISFLHCVRFIPTCVGQIF